MSNFQEDPPAVIAGIVTMFLEACLGLDLVKFLGHYAVTTVADDTCFSKSRYPISRPGQP
ncbi:uncharacterized protein F4812DRAFT_462482 [Daldinia caldariorum]|uniref:uncharacterized protein n=1 Tax=Daldinia caldariorum TaxID=326644 RepID=UPI0020078A18|nr:uncharacterized protein F4812DRAFT_462482 [Daldinia caldariorum]KAI1464773.1 hypothetical protein F4812DRAFT_462482 [Daldinia caldariorum]